MSNEEKALLAEAFDEYGDNERNSQSVFLLVHADGVMKDMNSSPEELRRRGYIKEADVVQLEGKTVSELCKLLSDDEAAVRTAAVRLLGRSNMERGNLAEQLLVMLMKEKALYTRLAICELLEAGEEETASLMIPYLGRIGKNQYQRLPSEVSLKKSYPLPRDIIARSLGRMTTKISPLLYEVLLSNDTTMIREVLDAIGFMTFYNKGIATKECTQIIFDILDHHEQDEVIQWKAIMCLSAFPSEQSKIRLEAFSKKNDLIGREAKRALQLIKNRQE